MKVRVVIFLSVFLICCLFAGIYLSGYVKGMLPDKYLSHFSVSLLFENYERFEHSFGNFIRETVRFHEGDSDSSGRACVFLLPCFTFQKMLGGLTLKNLYLFNFCISILILIVFYKVSFLYIGRYTAICALFLLAMSSWFFDLSMSLTYHVPSLLIALIFMYFLYRCTQQGKLYEWFLFGAITVIGWHVYGLVRYLLFLVPIALWENRRDIVRVSAAFFLGFLPLFLVPFFVGCKLVVASGYVFDQEHLLWGIKQGSAFYAIWLENLVCVYKVFTGTSQAGNAVPHAPLVSYILVLPLLAGCYCLRYKRYRHVLWLAIVTTVIPVFASSSHISARRFLLYTIPVYMIIGIGAEYCAQFIYSIKQRVIKIIFWCITGIALCVFVCGEMRFVYTVVFSQSRGLGLVTFANDLAVLAPQKEYLYLLEETVSNEYPYTMPLFLTLVLRDIIPDAYVFGVGKTEPIDITRTPYIICEIRAWDRTHIENWLAIHGYIARRIICRAPYYVYQLRYKEKRKYK